MEPRILPLLDDWLWGIGDGNLKAVSDISTGMETQKAQEDARGLKRK